MRGQPFEAVVTEYGPMVLRVCRAALGFDDAKDAWSETSLAALRAYPELPEEANVEAWLVTIARCIRRSGALSLCDGASITNATPIGMAPPAPT
jgi:DNA-directed RNA polymerase specialized sigma24 family protein